MGVTHLSCPRNFAHSHNSVLFRLWFSSRFTRNRNRMTAEAALLRRLPESLRQSLQAFAQLGTVDDGRSEEHTSELQSRFDLVCRLLLEKETSANSYT